jgi:hypothetical protein
MCSIKTMIKIVIGIGVLLIAGYAAVPEMRNAIAIVGPYLLFLACPLAMFFMMKSMNMQDKQKSRTKMKNDVPSQLKR